jgi:hypothetical protein
MKWIVLAAFALVIFLIFRHINREQDAVPYPPDPSQPIPTPAPTQTEFAMCAPMSFDDFYNHYCASENIDREFVQRILVYVSRAGGFPRNSSGRKTVWMCYRSIRPTLE